MKKAVISTIFVSACLFSSAQDLSNIAYHDTISAAYLAVTKQQSEAVEDSSISGSRYYLVDNDGNSYNVVKIGDQFWMAENLRTTRFNDSTPIPQVSDYSLWGRFGAPGYCWYNNNEEKYKTKYGALYNGYSVSTGKLCPAGWHVPSVEEWMTLTSYCGEDMAGGKLKETNNWMSPNTGATNEIGFKARPGGSRGNLGSFMDEGLRGHWWSSTENDKANVWNRTMGYTHSNVTGSSDRKESGLSVRCIKD